MGLRALGNVAARRVVVRHYARCSIAAVLGIMGVVQMAAAQDEVTYRFERMWPTLQQPWYFTCEGLGSTEDGCLAPVGNGEACV